MKATSILRWTICCVLLAIAVSPASAVVITVNAGDDLRAAIGYWDDSEEERIAGTAVAGDVVQMTFTGTYDLGAADNVLYPAAGVFLCGPGSGSLTIQGRLYWRGSGGTTVVGRLAGWTLDCKGYDALPGTLVAVGSIGAYTCAAVDGMSIEARDFAITNSVPATSTDANNITVISRPDEDAIEGVWHSCAFTSANRDCMSLKGISTLAKSGSKQSLWDCSGSSPGSGAGDQAATPHDGHAMYIYGGTWAGNTAGGKYALGIGGTTILDVYNATIAGQITGVRKLIGCVVDGDGWTDHVVQLAANAEVSHCTIQADDLAGTTKMALRTADVGPAASISYVVISGAGGTALETRDTDAGNAVAIDHVLVDGLVRGIDVRFAATHDHTITNCVIATSSYSVLWASNASSVAGSVAAYATTPADLITASTITQDAKDALAEMVHPLVQSTPPWLESRRAILVGGGCPVSRSSIIGGGL